MLGERLGYAVEVEHIVEVELLMRIFALMYSESAKAHGDAFNEMPCVAEGRCKRKEAKPTPDGYAWRFRLNATDLRAQPIASTER
ncbi:MAG: hypothetical protein ABWK05_02005 [Pyrobaculum sp.]